MLSFGKTASLLTVLLSGVLAFPTDVSVGHDLDARALPVRQLIDQTTYNNIIKYAGFCKASATQPCNKPPFGAVTVKETSIQSTDTQASVYRLDSNKEIIVAFPGTDSTIDVLTDLTTIPLPYSTAKNCSQCLVHAGFANAFLSIAPTLNTTLQQTVRSYPTYTITITGYSLGGALAKLSFDYFKDSTLFGAKVTGGWTYGESRVGNAAFANYSDTLSGATDSNVGMYHRVTHANDIVPQVPPTLLDFQHSRTEFWEMNNATTGVPSVNTTYRCFGQEPTDCVNSQGGLGAMAHTSYPGLNDFNTCS